MQQYLECTLCHRQTPIKAETVCSDCFGPLEVRYDMESLRGTLKAADIQNRPSSMWRYHELLPYIEHGTPATLVGWTPLVPTPQLGKALGLCNLYVKNDAVNFPSLSFKDRVVSAALAKAVDFGFNKVACASTGNLANALGAQTSMLGLQGLLFIPENLEPQKILGSACYNSQVIKVKGNYDAVNRFCTELTYRENIGVVNVNLRPFYSEGSKTVGFEIAEQLGWQLPDQVVVPMAGGSLVSRIGKAFSELQEVGLVPEKRAAIFGAQATGCAPIATLVKTEADQPIAVSPDTLVKSLAIGAPADGLKAAKTIRGSGGWAEDVSDDEAVAGIVLLAETEGIFAEAAGGVTVAVTQKLLQLGKLDPDAVTVLCITGNGFKTADLIASRAENLPVIEPKYSAYLELNSNKLEESHVSAN